MTLAIKPPSRVSPATARTWPPSRPTVRIVARRSRYGTAGFGVEIRFPGGRTYDAGWHWDRVQAAEFAVYLLKQRGDDDWDSYLRSMTYGEWKGGQL